MRDKTRRAEYQAEYRKQPGMKERRAEYDAEYIQRPGMKERREWSQDQPEGCLWTAEAFTELSAEIKAGKHREGE